MKSMIIREPSRFTRKSVEGDNSPKPVERITTVNKDVEEIIKPRFVRQLPTSKITRAKPVEEIIKPVNKITRAKPAEEIKPKLVNKITRARPVEEIIKEKSPIILPKRPNLTQRSPPRMAAPVLSKYLVLYDEENVPYIPLPNKSKMFDYDSEQPIEILNNYNLTLDMIIPNAQGSYQNFITRLNDDIMDKYGDAFDINKLLNIKFLESEFKGLLFNNVDNPKFNAEIKLSEPDITYGEILYEVGKSLPVDYESYFPKYRHFDGLRKVGKFYEMIIT